MDIINEELEFWDWLTRINEKITLIRLKVLNHNDIIESDYDVLRVFHSVFYRGEYPLYESKMVLPAQVVTESGLFAETHDGTSVDTTESPDGTDIANLSSEPIKTDNNE